MVLRQIESELTTIARHLESMIVEITHRSGGGGSGVIWRDDGLIVTNSHVIGVIHSLNRRDDFSMIAADIKLAPGNSGGVLANVRSEIIGINTAIYQNLAFSIPSHFVLDWLESVGI